MSWLRIDDSFPQHPKLAGWTPTQRWAWLEVLAYCARFDTAGRIPEDLTLMPRSTTPALLAKAENSRLIDRADDGGRVVHDWPIYNAPTIGEKVAYYLTMHPDASANDVYKAIGGTREIVLAEVKRQREGGSISGSASGSASGSTEPPPEPASPVSGGSKGGSESGSRARDPVPNPKRSSKSRPSLRPPTRNGLPPAQQHLLDKLLTTIGDHADQGTEQILRTYAQQATEAQLARVLESAQTQRPRNIAAYIVGALRDELAGAGGDERWPGEPDTDDRTGEAT